jgi:D-sedoheptulose 7-phosphate isomerase
MMRAVAGMLPDVRGIAGVMVDRLAGGGRVYWFGNGGSSTQAQHFAAELVCRFERERRGLASIALSTDTSVMTAVANDYAFEDVFARQVEALVRREDVVVGLSTCGASANVLQGIDAARSIGAYTVGMTGGDGGKLAKMCDAVLIAPSDRTCRIQEAHLFLGHTICDLVEAAAGSPAGKTGGHVRSN